MPEAWDIVACTGLASIVVGIAFIWWPLALIVGGVFIVALYAIREYANVPVSRNPEDEAAAGGNREREL